ncbi:MAG: class I SAM-dependent methyltransferase [Geobacteraceae bacterium]
MYLYPPGRADLDLRVFCLPAEPGARMLEIGCGSGEMLKWLAEHGWEVEGLDFDPQAVQNALSKGLKVYLGSIESQEFPANSFDVIVMNHVIEHVPNPAALLHECYRILKPGGKLVSVTPNVQSLGHKLFSSSWFHLDPPRHLILFTPAALHNLADSIFSRSSTVFSTIRGANGPIMASLSIARTGRYLMGGKSTLLFRIFGKCLQFVEWGIKFFKPLVGEELVPRNI